MAGLIGWIRTLTFALTIATTLASIGSVLHSAARATTQAQPNAANDKLGAVFISSAEIAQSNGRVPDYRFDRANALGAAWDRLPFYWSNIEPTPNVRDYTWQRVAVDADIARGLQVNAILMNTPSWAASTSAAALSQVPEPRVGQAPRYIAPPAIPLSSEPASIASTTPPSVYLSVFSDNTDTPGPSKTINERNYWARFVYYTVSEFKSKVKVWEIWNEPDHPFFWTGTVSDYYRLLKVGYLAAKHADANAIVLMGGMAYWPNPGFFESLLQLIKADSSAPANNYYFDATAWHWYSRSSQMFDMVNLTRSTLAKYGLGHKPIWVNETGVPIWDDPAKPPPGGNNEYFASATQAEAAAYVIQAIAYGLAANVQRILYFQMYDDGNSETFGLVRNDNSVRPSFAAYQVAARYLPNYSLVQKATDGDVEKIVFWGTPFGKVTVLWNRSPVPRTYSLAAAPGRTRAYRVDKAGTITSLPSDASYSIALAGATNDNGVPMNSGDYIIGGDPFIVVEEVPYALPYQLYLPLVFKNNTTN